VRYQLVIDAGIRDGMMHSQYGLEYDFSDYPKRRLEQPFTRVENRQK